MTARSILRLLAATLVLSAAASVASHARIRYKRDFGVAYPKTNGTRLDACQTCHLPGVSQAPGKLNPYGEALKKAGLKFAVVESADSDKDGFTNRKEIDALSFPGNPKDRPGARADSTKADSTQADSTKTGSAKADSALAKPDSAGAKPDTGVAPRDSSKTP